MREKTIATKEKLRILEELLEKEHSIYELSDQYDVTPKLITQWIEQLFQETAKLFKNNSNETDIEIDEDFDDSLIFDYYEPKPKETCDWCGSPDVTYRDGAYTLCESCEEQLYGDYK